MKFSETVIQSIVRRYIRKKMHRRQLREIFLIIQEEYSHVYHEDNIGTRKAYLDELIDTTIPPNS